ncbi:hypothetical protein KNE206_68560 [Kitasatospora sp. NE20-6]
MIASTTARPQRSARRERRGGAGAAPEMQRRYRTAFDSAIVVPGAGAVKDAPSSTAALGHSRARSPRCPRYGPAARLACVAGSGRRQAAGGGRDGMGGGSG